MTIFIPATLRTFIPTTSQLKTTTKALLQHDWAPALERFCRGLAVAIALAYASGWLLGTWVHQSSALLGRTAAELAVRETHIDDPQPALPLIDAPLPSTPQEAMPQEAMPQETTPPVVVRTTRSKLPKPAPKPTRQRRAKGSSRTSAPAIA
ncbi:MAG: hypothetical protein LW834_21860 [Cyanobium sp. 49614_E6]|nr:hypothetical protein [Cyanobium sp. 49614_E6]